MFTSKSMVECQAHAGHVPSTEHHRIFYIRETESLPWSLIIFSIQFIHISHSEGRRVTPSPQAYFLSPLKISLETGGHRLVLPVKMLVVVIIYIIENITNKSAALCTTGHFGQEVREIEPCSKMADE
jgi:hypothetical protein